jgi:hypothetical protein
MQCSIDGFCPLQGTHIHNQIGEGIGIGNRASIADFRMHNTKFFGLAIDTAHRQSAAVERVVEGTDAVRGDALNASTFPVVILDTARAFGKLHMLVGRPGLLEKERRTLEPQLQKNSQNCLHEIKDVRSLIPHLLNV